MPPSPLTGSQADEVAETIKDDSSSDITGDLEEDCLDKLAAFFDETDPLVPDPFQEEDWYLRDFMQRADEIAHPVQGCALPSVLQQLHDGEREFWNLQDYQIEQLEGAGVKLKPKRQQTPSSSSSMLPPPDYFPDYSLPLEQRMLNLLDHMQPGFKKILS